MEFLSTINWRRGQPIDEIENIILVQHGMGLPNQEIANNLNRDIKTVNKWLEGYYETARFRNLPKPSRPRKTTAQQDQAIALAAINNPFMTREHIRHQIDINFCLEIISKRLNESKLFARVARIRVSLSAVHRAYRLQFAEQFANFNRWDRTVFVDEATFQTGHAVRTIV
jgi:transposase